jgi:hypothetical protein
MCSTALLSPALSFSALACGAEIILLTALVPGTARGGNLEQVADGSAVAASLLAVSSVRRATSVALLPCSQEGHGRDEFQLVSQSKSRHSGTAQHSTAQHRGEDAANKGVMKNVR